MNKIRVGVIGAGSMGKNHIRLYKELINECDFIGFYDINENSAKTISNDYQAEYFNNAMELLKNVDAVTIAVPTYLHKEYGFMCADMGKHILMEKPICKSIDEAYELVEMCEKKGIILQIGHVERYNPAIRELSKILSKEDVISLDFHRMSPYDKRIFDTDIVKDLMIHDIDVTNLIVQDDIEDIIAKGVKVYSDKYVDYAQAIIKFRKGYLTSLTASRVTEDKVRTLKINTKNAYIDVDYLNKSINISRRTNFKLDTGYDILYRQENVVEKVQVQMSEPLRVEIIEFLSCVRNNQRPLIDGKAGIKALSIAEEICNKIYDGVVGSI